MSSISRVSWGSIVAAGLIAIALAFMAVSLKTGLLQFRGADRVVSVKGLAEREVPVQTIAKVLGHKTLEMSMRYTKITDKARKNAINAL